jgi:tungstate transport system permease protein
MESEFWAIIARSLGISGTAVLISVLLGVPLGVRLGFSGDRQRRVWAVIIRTGMALPPVVVGLVLYILLSRSGPLGAIDWLFTPQAMILAQTILALPFVMGITMNSVEAVPADLGNQLRSLGASEWQCRWAVLREARQGVLLAVAIAFGRSISEVGAVLIVGGNIHGHTRVLTTAIILETGQGRFEFALALGGALLLLAFLVNFLIVYLYQGGRAL